MVSYPSCYSGTERKKRYPIMNASTRPTVSAFPTIEWLRQRAADRQPAVRQPLRHFPSRPSSASRLLGIMRSMLDASVLVEEGSWVATPDGELPVDIVLRRGGRSLAICCRPAWIDADSDQDALLLVYGGFDVLYRCSIDDSLESVVDATYALMHRHANWFSSFGRLSLGRRASDGIVAAALGSDGIGSVVSGPNGSLQALRLHVASDWVKAFERALKGGSSLALSA